MPPTHGVGRSHYSSAATTSSSSSAQSPLLSRPLLSLLLLLAAGAFALCLLEVRTLTSGGAASSSQPASHATTESTQRTLSRLQPMSAFRPIQRLAGDSSDSAQSANSQHARAQQPQQSQSQHHQRAEYDAAVVGHRYDPWVSPLSNVHEWPPASPTVSTYRWKSHATPLWQMVLEAKGQTVDFASVGIRSGRLVFYGLSEAQKAELLASFEPFMHFDGVDARVDRVEDVTEFEDAPLDWTTCSTLQPSYSFFVTPWMPMMYYHVVSEHLINGYANLRSANALSQRLFATFASPALSSSHPRSLFHDPLPPFLSDPAHLSPFTSAHLDNSSHAALYVFSRWKQMEASQAIDLLYRLFDGHVADFRSLESDTLTCFRRIRWGRGVPLHYFARVFPFPLPPAAPVWSDDRDTYAPPAAKRLAKDDLDLYTDVELGRWAGLMIDFHNFIVHMLGRERRVREARDSNTHEPLPGSSVEPPASPRVLLLTRGVQQGRFIANRDCLTAAFAAHSPPLTLTPCCDWQAPLTSTIAEFHAADILVGLHGAGFTNLLWMPPGGLVVEVKTHFNADNNYFHPLSNHLDHAYKVVDGRQFHKGDAGYHFTPDWCAQLADTVWAEWTHKHSAEGRFNNVYGVGNFSVDWMRQDNGGVKPIARH